MPKDDIHPLQCPYCGYEQQHHNPDRTSGELRYESCENCGKTFLYSVRVDRDYWSYES